MWVSDGGDGFSFGKGIVWGAVVEELLAECAEGEGVVEFGPHAEALRRVVFVWALMPPTQLFQDMC